jgi:acetoacetyl-CoA synthetase
MSTLLRFSPFVQIKAGTEKPPIVIAHGLSGVVQFSELAQHIQTGRPIYGIQAKGIDGKEEPLERVEDMAELYLDALAELYPSGPYILIGYSFGGLVALEMAQRLVVSGKTVALLVLLDAYPHPHFLPGPDRLRLFMKRVRSHAKQIRELPLANAVSYFVNGLKRRLHFPGALHESQRPPETLGLSFAETALRRVNQKAYLAYSRYQPRFYRGKIKFVTTEIKSFFPGNPVRVWGKQVSELEIEVIPGDHLNIVTTEFKALASVLTRYLKTVEAREEGV